MTLVNIDLKNAGYEAGPDDRVIFYSLLVREGEFGTISTAPVEVALTDGQATVDLAPGPVGVQIIAGMVADTRVKIGEVPPSGPTTLNAVMMVTPAYTPALQAAMIAAIERARDESLSDVDRATAAALADAIQPLQAAAAAAQSAAQSSSRLAADADVRAANAESSAVSAQADAESASHQAGTAISRVAALEAMAGMSPESPVDGQTANLISQPGSLSNAAVGSVAVPRVTTAAQESATLGPELVTSTGWSFGPGWSGDLASGFTKTPGSVGTLRWAPGFTVGTDVFLVEWKWEGAATHQDVYSGYDVYFGGGYAGITYQGAAPANQSYSRAVKAVEDRGFELVPWDGFEGRIHSISIRKVLSAAAVGIGWRTSGGTRGGELRFGDAQANSVYLGIDSGKWNTTGNRNAAVGDYAMANNVTGFFNAALGFEALSLNVNGTRNVAVGYRALRENVAGDRNVGIGPFALTRLTTGQRNVAIGTDTLWRLTDGNDNVGIGYLTQTELRRGSENVAIGRYAMRHTHGGSGGGTVHNIAIGTEALGHVTGSMNIGIGRRALASVTTTAQGSVAIGDLALEATTANQDTAVGKESLRYVTGGRNTAIGWNSGKGVAGQSTGTRNVFVGDNAGIGITTGSQNTVVGPSAGSNITTQTGNILIGFGVVGLSGRDSYLSIGSTIMGDLSSQQIGIGINNPTARLHLKTSTGAAGTAPLKIDGGTLLATPEVGALEFASGKLYFTTSTGNRREIAFVTT